MSCYSEREKFVRPGIFQLSIGSWYLSILPHTAIKNVAGDLYNSEEGGEDGKLYEKKDNWGGEGHNSTMGWVCEPIDSTALSDVFNGMANQQKLSNMP